MIDSPFGYENDFATSAKSAYFETDRPNGFSNDHFVESPTSQEIYPLGSSLMLHDPDLIAASSKFVRPALAPNQRQYSRCPISEDCTPATLNMNGQDYNCHIVQLSIGGFGVITEKRPKFSNGVIGFLRGTNLNYIVSVTHRESRDDATYIGLRQIEEVIEPKSSSTEYSPIVGYVIAGLAGAFIIGTAYCLMTGS